MKIHLFIFLLLILLSSSCAFFLGMRGYSTGTHGNLESFYLSYSKAEVNSAFKLFFKNSPQNLPPKKLKLKHNHYDFGDTIQNNLWNADSVNYYFLLKKSNNIIWVKYSGRQKNWYEISCKIAIISSMKYIGGRPSIFKLNSMLTRKEKREIIRSFKKEILKPLLKILEKKVKILESPRSP